MDPISFNWHFRALVICTTGLIKSRNSLRSGKMSITT